MNEAKAKAIAAEIEAVCKKHGVVLVGVSSSTGIYGEIIIHERGDRETWDDMETRRQNFSEAEDGDDYQVDVFGNEPAQEAT